MYTFVLLYTALHSAQPCDYSVYMYTYIELWYLLAHKCMYMLVLQY